MTVQNGLGAEEVVRRHGDWPLLSAITFMSGTRHSDTEVEYVLDTPTWLGPHEAAPRERAEVAALIVSSGLKAEAFADLRPAQWSKLIFNATVNGVAALTGLPRSTLRRRGRRRRAPGASFAGSWTKARQSQSRQASRLERIRGR